MFPLPVCLPKGTKLWHGLDQKKITSSNVCKGVWDVGGAVTGVKITRSAVKCWPQSLGKERASIYPDLLALACASKGGSGAAALRALTPGQVAVAKMWVLLRKSQLLTGAVRI